VWGLGVNKRSEILWWTALEMAVERRSYKLCLRWVERRGEGGRELWRGSKDAAGKERVEERAFPLTSPSPHSPTIQAVAAQGPHGLEE
jgi:hypothetical protein